MQKSRNYYMNKLNTYYARKRAYNGVGSSASTEQISYNGVGSNASTEQISYYGFGPIKSSNKFSNKAINNYSKHPHLH
jgi:hypothetical protein